MKPRKISAIVIDDDPVQLTLIEEVFGDLEEYDVSTIGFTSIERGLEAFDNSSVDLICVDFCLEGTATALDVIRKLRARGDWRPIVVISGMEESSPQVVRMVADGFRLGAHDFLHKDDLMNEKKITEALDRCLALQVKRT